jgi:hypothetical protein
VSFRRAFSTYEEWVDYPYASRIVLLELQPAELITGWTATAATTGVFQAAFPCRVQTALIAGGLYRRLDGIEENGEPLTQVGSVAAADAAPGSWFYDGSSTVYVSTTTGSNPTVLASVNAVFTIFMATEALDVAGGELYEGRLSGTLPQVDGQVDSLYGAKVYTTGEFTLANGDALFDALAQDWAWHGRAAVILLGGRELPLAEFSVVARMQIDRVLPGDDNCRVVLLGEQDAFGRYLPLRTLTRTEHPNMGDSGAGSYVPLLLGSVQGIAPPIVDRTPGATVYLLADPQVQELSAVWDVRVLADAGTIGLSEGTDYTVSLANCTVTVTRADLADRQIICSASGETSITDMAAAISQLLQWLGEPVSSIDATSFANAADLRPEPFGLWLREGRPSAEYFSMFEASMLAALVRDRDGKWALEVDDFEADLSATPHLQDEDWSAWLPVPGQSGVDAQVSSVVVRFANVAYADTWDETEAGSDTARYLQRSERSWSVSTVLIHRGDAARLAQHYRLLLLSRAVSIEIREKGLSLMTATPAQMVRATRDRAPGGPYAERPLRLARISKALSPPGISATLLDRPDAVEVYPRARAWAPDTVDTWAAASQEQRDDNAFWHDDNDEVTTGVPDHSRWI